jgi:hypothetical protein
MRSASHNNAAVFVAARGLSIAPAHRTGLQVEVFAIEDEHTARNRAQWNGIPLNVSSNDAAGHLQLRTEADHGGKVVPGVYTIVW